MMFLCHSRTGTSIAVFVFASFLHLSQAPSVVVAEAGMISSVGTGIIQDEENDSSLLQSVLRFVEPVTKIFKNEEQEKAEFTEEPEFSASIEGGGYVPYPYHLNHEDALYGPLHGPDNKPRDISRDFLLSSRSSSSADSKDFGSRSSSSSNSLRGKRAKQQRMGPSQEDEAKDERDLQHLYYNYGHKRNYNYGYQRRYKPNYYYGYYNYGYPSSYVNSVTYPYRYSYRAPYTPSYNSYNSYNYGPYNYNYVSTNFRRPFYYSF